MVAATYYSKVTTGITIFTGYVTNIPGAGSAANPAKDELTTSSANLPASGSSIKMFSGISGVGVGRWAKSYASSMVISAVTFNGYCRGNTAKTFWMKSYTSAGAVHQSGSGTGVAGPAGTAQTNLSFGGQSVTVPAGGALVISVDYASTGRLYLGVNPKTNNNATEPDSVVINLTEVAAGPTGPQASGAITDGNDVAAGVADVQKISITHTFRNEADSAAWANGINVVAYKASTMSAAVPTVMGNAAIAGGAGSVTIILTENVAVVLVPDHQHASAPAGEQGISEALTPTVA